MKLKGALLVFTFALVATGVAASAQIRGEVVFPGGVGKDAKLTVVDSAGGKFIADLSQGGRFDLSGLTTGPATLSIQADRQVLDIPSMHLDAGINEVKLYFPAELSADARTAAALEANQRGVELLGRGDYADALSQFSAALVADTSQAATWGSMALANIGLRRYEDAVFCSKMASRFDPRESSYVNNLGGAYYRMGSYDRAAECYERAATVNPDGAGLYLSNAAAAYLAKGDIDRAVTSYEKAITVTGCPNASYFYLGYLLSRSGQSTRAVDFLREYLRRDPNGTYAGTARRLLGSASR